MLSKRMTGPTSVTTAALSLPSTPTLFLKFNLERLPVVQLLCRVSISVLTRHMLALVWAAEGEVLSVEMA